MATPPLLVVVGGIPGSGKSTLARRLGDALHLPVVHRDLVKTGMHHTVGSVDPAEQRRFAGPSFDAAFATTRGLLDAGSSVVLEAAFHRDLSGPALRDLAAGARARLVWTRCPVPVALDRYRARSTRGERHPAHNDEVMVEAMANGEVEWSTYEPPDGLSVAVRVDTSDGLVPPLATIIESVLA